MDTVGKNDKRLFLIVSGIAVFLSVIFLILQKPVTDGVVVVTVAGERYAAYPLSQNRTERIELPDGAYNLLEIREGTVDITEASCPDGICVAHRKISRTNQTIVCLPNQVVVKIEEAAADEVDFVVN